MILCVDIGNTAVKCAAVGAGEILFRDVESTPRFHNPTHRDDLLRRVAGAVLHFDQAIVSSVVPDLTAVTKKAIRSVIHLAALDVGPKLILPFELDMADPDRVGADRLCAAAGAIHGRRRHAIVIDVGSAITVDLIADGIFGGGVIMAGPRLVLGALGSHAARLPRLDPSPALKWPLGRINETEGAMATGARVASAGAIREAVKFVGGRRRISRVVMTGGDMEVVDSTLPRGWERDPDLVLRGLARIAALNRNDDPPPETA